MKKRSLIAGLGLFGLLAASGCVGPATSGEGDAPVAQESTLQLAQGIHNQLSSAQVRQLIANYYVAVRGLDLNNYLANFAKHGTLEDPVGTDPRRGLAEIAGAYQQAIDSFSILDMREQDVFTPDKTNEAAVRWTVSLTFKNGLKVDPFNGITYFKFDDAGKIASARAFWDPSALANAHF
ncbi:MAG: nuclear transport factor 2 family protein [Polyangia bacterium]